MKSLLYFICITFFASPAQCQSTGEVKKFEFTTLTRGYQKQVFITADSLIEIVDGRQEDNKIVKRKLEPAEWNELISGLESLKLESIPSLQSPTSRRAFDGARHSTITITTQDGKEWQHGFDDENPHPDLKAIMEVILRIETGSPQR